MPRSVTVSEKEIQDVADLFADVAHRRTMRQMLDEILTPTELRDLALRWKLVQRLHAGTPQRRIASDLGISLCKITRGSRILKRPRGAIRGILKQKAE